MSNVPHITQNFARPSYRPEVSGGFDPDMRRMAVIAAGIGGALSLMVAAVSLSHHVHHGIPVISPPAGPVRVKPLDPGGMKVLGGELGDAGGVETLAPPAEQPELRALHAKARVKVAAPVVAPTLPPVVAAAVPEAVAKVAPVVPHPNPPQGGEGTAPLLPGTMVQLGAFESEAAAAEEWRQIAGKLPASFAGRRAGITPATIAGTSIWRLRTGGFKDFAAATAFCQLVRAQGGDCSIAAF